MPDYLTSADLPLLQSKGFVAGFSGESWFGTDKNGATWQAYLLDMDPKITFIGPEDRMSVYMTRETFEELFA